MAEEYDGPGNEFAKKFVPGLKSVANKLDGYVKATKHEGVKKITDELSQIIEEMERMCDDTRGKDDSDNLEPEHGDKP
jgi:hypothetical protein